MPEQEDDKSGNGDPCPEDEEFFDARPDAATMEEVVVCTHSWLVHTGTNLVYIDTY